MPHVATMGTSSCATISIGGFKWGDAFGDNEKYKESGESNESEGLTVNEFYRKVLYPTSQPLGKSRDMPLRKLMDDIDESSLRSKLIMATLNHSQYMVKERYWHKELLECGFELVTKCSNSIGSTNYIYIRNPSKLEIEEGEASA